MIALVYLLFIAIDCKITKFSLHLFVYFFGNNYNIWWIHKHHFKRKNMSIIFTSATPITV